MNDKRPYILVVGLAVLAAVLGLVAGWWVGDREPPAPTEISFSELDPDLSAIRIRGTAHYMALIRQEIPGSIVREQQTYYVYGLFPPHDTTSRSIQLLVRTSVQPEQGVAFEYLELEGWLVRPDPYNVPFRTEEIFSRQSNYFFAEDLLVLEPWKQNPYDPGDEARREDAPPPPAPAVPEEDASP